VGANQKEERARAKGEWLALCRFVDIQRDKNQKMPKTVNEAGK